MFGEDSCAIIKGNPGEINNVNNKEKKRKDEKLFVLLKKVLI